MKGEKQTQKFLFSTDDVKALRKAAGLTQQQAAESMHLKSSSSWRDWESGRYPMSEGNVEYFCLKNGLPVVANKSD